MKKSIFLFIFAIIATISFTACSKSEDDSNKKEEPVDSLAQYKTQGQHLRRTIIAYMCGDNNNLSKFLKEDVKEMIEGSKTLEEDCRLILLADFDNKTPYISEIRKGKEVVMREYENDFYVTSPDSMLSIMKWIISNYPADEYATVFGGHGSGAIIEQDTIKTDFVSLKAYGPDGTATKPANRQWMNIPSMAKVFSQLPKMEFIFFDCCAMGNVETMYELRNAAHYIIAPVSETPGDGAPYKTIVPILSLDRMLVGGYIIDHYIQDTKFTFNGVKYDGICLTCVKTDELENLRNATYNVLRKFPLHPSLNRLQFNLRKMIEVNPGQYKNVSAVYFYNLNDPQYLFGEKIPILHDMKSIFYLNGLEVNEKNAGTDFQEWNEWKTWNDAINRAVVARYPKNGVKKFLWYSTMGINEGSFTFTVDDNNYCGLSMIVPYDRYDNISPSLNSTMFDLQWVNAMDWHSLGW